MTKKKKKTGKHGSSIARNRLLDGKTVLITGGTGSFGKNFSKFLLDNYNLKKLIIYSRDEFKHFELEKSLQDDRIRFFIGDIRDEKRLTRAFDGVDIVIHAAALKQVPTLEYNPFEAVKTNILGTQNVIEEAINSGVEKVLLISTDKSAQPVNLYGATKLCAERLMVSGNAYAKNTKLSAVRYGNVIGSRGSIIETLLNNRDIKKVQITDPEMTRFWISLEESFELVLSALENMLGGDIFVPKVPSMKLVDLFTAMAPQAEQVIIGLRPGEKIHETLVTEYESGRTFDFGNNYVIIPEFAFGGLSVEDFYKYYGKLSAKKLEPGYPYTSDNNKQWLTKNDFQKIIKNFNAI